MTRHLGDPASLRPWRDDDADDLLTAFAGSGMVSQGADEVRDHAAAAAWIARNPWQPDGTAASLAIDVDGRAVGNVSLSGINRHHDTAWVSYWVAEARRGRGLATRATATIAAWALREGGLYRLELGHRLNNPESGRVARRAGFLREGTQREKLRYGDERFDVGTYARLASDPEPAVALLPLRVIPARADRP